MDVNINICCMFRPIASAKITGREESISPFSFYEQMIINHTC